MKKYGFTLVELLAVIIILAIIAVIAIPAAINVIHDVNKNAFKNTAYGLIDAVKLKYAENYLSGNTEELLYVFPNADGLSYSGEKPDGGTIRLMNDGKISLAIHNNKWCATKGKDDSNVSILDYKDGKCLLPEEANIPIITLNGEDSMYLDIGETYIEPGYTVKTVGGEELSNDRVKVTVKGQMTGKTDIDTSIEEIYTITYTVEYEGITNVETRTIHVGNHKPIVKIEPNGTNGYESLSEITITVKAFEQYHIDGFKYVITKDGVEGEIIQVEKLSEIISFTDDGIYQIKVIATDSDNNTNEFTSEIYQIDLNEPVITFAEGDDVGIEIPISNVVSYDLMTDVDLVDTTVTINDVDVIGNLTSMVGYYNVRYIVTDKAGHTTSKIRKVYVVSDVNEFEEVYISSVKYKEDVDANLENNQVQAYQTTLDGSIGLSDSNSVSEITLTVTVTNNTDHNCQLLEIVPDNNSSDIIYSIDRLNEDTIIPVDGSITFDITFQYKAGVNLSEIENKYDVSLEFDFREILNLSYEYITNNGYPTTVLKGTDLVIDFVSHIPEGIYIKNTENYTYENSKLTVKNVQNDMVISNTLAYSHTGAYTFSGTNYIDTGVKLFSEDNFDRNFEVLFTISKYNTDNSMGTIFNSIDEVNLDYPGIAFRVNKSSVAYEFVSNNLANDFVQKQEMLEFSTIQKVRILRLDDVFYYSFNDGDYFEFQNFSVFNEYFDVPVTFGASYDENGEPFRYFIGTLSNMQIRFLDDNIDVNSYINPYYLEYKQKGSYIFDGTNYIDTSVYLFNKENIHKDFRILFTISSYPEEPATQATIVSALDESDEDYPGVMFRVTKAATQFEVIANDDARVDKPFEFEDVTKVEILRESDIVYYRINDGEYVEIQDYSDYSGSFDVPVTFGAGIDAEGNPWRYFTGTLKDFEVRMRHTVGN